MILIQACYIDEVSFKSDKLIMYHVTLNIKKKVK